MIAKDLAVETTKQGEKLGRLDEHVTVARDNAKGGLKELTEAEQHQKKGGRCLYIILAIIIVVVAIILGIVFGVKK